LTAVMLQIETHFRIPRVMHQACHPDSREGAGNAGRSTAPAALRAMEESTQASLQVRRNIRHSLRDGLAAYTCSCVPGLLATVASPNRLRRNLIPASGDQDHTILPSAPISLAWRYRRVHRILFQRLWRLAKRPSARIRMRGYKHNFRKNGRKILMPGTEISDQFECSTKSAFRRAGRVTIKSETMTFDLCHFEIVSAAAS
jgi:hypothetical protein